MKDSLRKRKYLGQDNAFMWVKGGNGGRSRGYGREPWSQTRSSTMATLCPALRNQEPLTPPPGNRGRAASCKVQRQHVCISRANHELQTGSGNPQH